MGIECEIHRKTFREEGKTSYVFEPHEFLHRLHP
jgi:hypothetical protein